MRPRSTLRPVQLTVLIIAYVGIGFLILWTNDGNHSGRVLGMAGLTYGFIAAADAWAWPPLESSNGRWLGKYLFKPAVAFFVWAAVVAAAGAVTYLEEDWSAWEPVLFFGLAVLLAAVGFYHVKSRGGAQRQ